MSRLEELKAATSLLDVAKLLGFTPKGLAYVLYKVGGPAKYRTFEIPKKGGGTRTIEAPTKQLSLLQKRLADRLYDCVEEIRKKNKRRWHPSHGFQKGRTIVTNASVHRKQRFVFNLDLEGFFGAINFGRVRGFF